MPADLDQLADRIRRHFDDGCFACGRANPIGLSVDGFRLEGDELVAAFTPRTEHRGAPQVLHGGVTASALDEILAWAGMVTERVVVVTGTLEVRYRKPVPINGERVELRGRLDERHGRRLRLSGSLHVGGAEAASATGIYVVMHRLDDVIPELP